MEPHSFFLDLSLIFPIQYKSDMKGKQKPLCINRLIIRGFNRMIAKTLWYQLDSYCLRFLFIDLLNARMFNICAESF